MDWLRKFGYDRVPETIEEYHDALYKFRHNDPDGNGIKDTYGMSGDLLSYYTLFTEIFGAHGVMPFNWMEKDGKVVWGGVQSETKETLALLRQWYKEEIIHPDFQTDRWVRETVSKFTNGRTGYNNYLCSKEALNPNSPSSLPSMMSVLQPGSELAPGHPPTGPRGERGHRVWGAAGGSITVFGKQMAQHPEKVIRVMKMMDALYADIDFYVQSKVGIKGTHWDWKDPKVGEGSGTRLLPPFNDRHRRTKEGFVDPTMFGDDTDPEFAKKYLPREMLEFRAEHRKAEWGRPDLFNWNDTVPRADEFLKDLIHLQQVYFADIITGTRPLSAFDEFAAKWHKQGGDILLKEAQNLYDSKADILRQLGAENGK
jgi:putative aldouronate transport system substrate-binding protein